MGWCRACRCGLACCRLCRRGRCVRRWAVAAKVVRLRFLGVCVYMLQRDERALLGCGHPGSVGGDAGVAVRSLRAGSAVPLRCFCRCTERSWSARDARSWRRRPRSLCGLSYCRRCETCH